MARTTPDECRELGTRLAAMVRESVGPASVFLPLNGNANEIVLDMAREFVTVVEQTPVLAGVNAQLCIHRNHLLRRAESGK